MECTICKAKIPNCELYKCVCNKYFCMTHLPKNKHNCPVPNPTPQPTTQPTTQPK